MRVCFCSSKHPRPFFVDISRAVAQVLVAQLRDISLRGYPKPFRKCRNPSLCSTKHQAGPQWIEHVLESLEHDRERGDIAGISVSLITLARIFIDQNDIERAKQRLREALPYVQRSGLQSIMGVFARLWGEIAAAEGSIDSAKTWLKDAIKAFDADGQTGKANDVRRLLERL